MTFKTLTLAMAVTLCGATLAFAHPTPGSVVKISDSGHAASHGQKTMNVHKVGDLEIEGYFARATPPNAPVSAGYMLIRNTGSEPDRLIGGSAEFAGRVEIHEMAMDGDVMMMREIDGGLEIPPGGEVVLEPGGLHVMFMQLGERLQEGETRTVILEFENAGSTEMAFPVRMVKRGSSGMDHSKHKGSH